MSVVVEYKGYYVPFDSTPQDVLDEWETTLKSMRASILANLKEKIANATDFLNKIANPAVEAWQAFVASDWEDREMILLKHQVKLKGAYDEWNTGIENAFAEGGTFDTNVTNKKAKFDMVRYVLGAVGLKYKTAWGPAYKAVAVISGDRRVKNYMGTNDSFSGDVVNVFLPGARKIARVGILYITQGLVIAQYAHENGLTTERDSVISTINTYLANSVLKMIDTSAYSEVQLQIGYDSVADKLFAYSKAVTV